MTVEREQEGFFDQDADFFTDWDEGLTPNSIGARLAEMSKEDKPGYWSELATAAINQDFGFNVAILTEVMAKHGDCYVHIIHGCSEVKLQQLIVLMLLEEWKQVKQDPGSFLCQKGDPCVQLMKEMVLTDDAWEDFKQVILPVPSREKRLDREIDKLVNEYLTKLESCRDSDDFFLPRAIVNIINCFRMIFPPVSERNSDVIKFSMRFLFLEVLSDLIEEHITLHRFQGEMKAAAAVFSLKRRFEDVLRDDYVLPPGAGRIFEAAVGQEHQFSFEQAGLVDVAQKDKKIRGILKKCKIPAKIKSERDFRIVLSALLAMRHEIRGRAGEFLDVLIKYSQKRLWAEVRSKFLYDVLEDVNSRVSGQIEECRRLSSLDSDALRDRATTDQERTEWPKFKDQVVERSPELAEFVNMTFHQNGFLKCGLNVFLAAVSSNSNYSFSYAKVDTQKIKTEEFWFSPDNSDLLFCDITKHVGTLLYTNTLGQTGFVSREPSSEGEAQYFFAITIRHVITVDGVKCENLIVQVLDPKFEREVPAFVESLKRNCTVFNSYDEKYACGYIPADCEDIQSLRLQTIKSRLDIMRAESLEELRLGDDSASALPDAMTPVVVDASRSDDGVSRNSAGWDTPVTPPTEPLPAGDINDDKDRTRTPTPEPVALENIGAAPIVAEPVRAAMSADEKAHLEAQLRELQAKIKVKKAEQATIAAKQQQSAEQVKRYDAAIKREFPTLHGDLQTLEEERKQLPVQTEVNEYLPRVSWARKKYNNHSGMQIDAGEYNMSQRLLAREEARQRGENVEKYDQLKLRMDLHQEKSAKSSAKLEPINASLTKLQNEAKNIQRKLGLAKSAPASDPAAAALIEHTAAGGSAVSAGRAQPAPAPTNRRPRGARFRSR